MKANLFLLWVTHLHFSKGLILSAQNLSTYWQQRPLAVIHSSVLKPPIVLSKSFQFLNYSSVWVRLHYLSAVCP